MTILTEILLFSCIKTPQLIIWPWLISRVPPNLNLTIFCPVFSSLFIDRFPEVSSLTIQKFMTLYQYLTSTRTIKKRMLSTLGLGPNSATLVLYRL